MTESMWAILYAMNMQWSKRKIGDEPVNVWVGGPGMLISTSEMNPAIT